MNVLFIGPCSSEWALRHAPVSLAATKWSEGFLRGLQNEANVVVLTHSAERAWPIGRKIWRGYDARLFPDWVDCRAISYPPLKFIRELWLGMAYRTKVVDVIRERSIDVVFFYNCDARWQVSTMRRIKTCFGGEVKVVPIILDGKDPNQGGWGWVKRAAHWSDAMVAMSVWLHERLPTVCGRPSYRLDSGADTWHGVPPVSSSGEKVLVHTGSLDEMRGLDLMKGIVNHYAESNVRFVFCGKETEMLLKHVFGDNPKVSLPGCVSADEMDRLCNGADVLLNVRDPNHPDNTVGFPSKISRYLSYGRPVVSTRLQSLGVEYDEVIHFSEDNSVEAYCSLVDRLLALTDQERNEEYARLHDWFETHKRWDVLTHGLLAWIKTLK